MTLNISTIFFALPIAFFAACSQGTTTTTVSKRNSSADSKPEPAPETPYESGDNNPQPQPGETADVPKVVNGAYLYCQANDKLIDDKYLVKCQIRNQADQRIDISAAGLSVQFAYEAKEEDGIFVDLTNSIDDKSFDAIYIISGRDYADLDLFSKGMTFKAEISEIQSGDSRTITLSGDRVTVTVVKTTNPPVISK